MLTACEGAPEQSSTGYRALFGPGTADVMAMTIDEGKTASATIRSADGEAWVSAS